MPTFRKRQKVSSACQRCRERKLGCDTERPCLWCTRAAVECIPRHVEAMDGVLAGDKEGESTQNNQINEGGTMGVALLPESSVVDLSRMIFARSGLGRVLTQDTSALPGGNKVADHTLASTESWRTSVGVQLPADDILEDLVRSFFCSVDWFMMVFHEDHFKRRYTELLRPQQTTSYDGNFTWVYMLVIALGAHYAALSPSSNQTSIDYQRLSQDLLANIEARFLQLVDCSTLETVQICVLLGSFLMFNGRPNAGLGISGSGVKVAQVIGLHRESLWKDTSKAVREEKRRTWWALEVFDKYAAIAFGRPCIIDDSDCEINMISGVTIREQISAENPLLAYHQWKFRLYRIVGPFLGRRRQLKRLESVHTIHQQLLHWQKELPNMLRLESYDRSSEQVSLLQMQALNLQLTYDNLQIILHRTVAFTYANEEGKLGTPNTESNTSIRQLLESAEKTSELYQYSPTLRACRLTHADMHIGITLFTAGVVLCAICLSQPMSEIGSRAKKGVMHIIHMCRNAALSSQHLLSSQSLGILDSLITVVLQRETNLITGRIGSATVIGPSNYGSSTPVQNGSSPVGTATLGAHAAGSEHSAATSSERPLQPIQEVFSHHMSRSTPRPATFQNMAGQGEPAVETLGPSAGDATAGFVWDGDLSFLVDAGLADASQSWLWADNLDFDSVNDLRTE